MKIFLRLDVLVFERMIQVASTTAMLFGRSTAQRARSLIAIAAPQFREQLERAAYELRLFHS